MTIFITLQKEREVLDLNRSTGRTPGEGAAGEAGTGAEGGNAPGPQLPVSTGVARGSKGDEEEGGVGHSVAPSLQSDMLMEDGNLSHLYADVVGERAHGCVGVWGRLPGLPWQPGYCIVMLHCSDAGARERAKS